MLHTPKPLAIWKRLRKKHCFLLKNQSPNNADDGTRKHTWEIKLEADGRKPLMKNYTCTDDPTKENHFSLNPGLLQEMVKNNK